MIVAWILDWGEKCKPKLGKHLKFFMACNNQATVVSFKTK